MGAFGVWGVLASLLGLVTGFLLGVAALDWAERRRVAASALSLDGSGRLRMRLGNGCGPLMPAARKLLRVGGVDAAASSAVLLLFERGLPVGKDSLVSVFLAATLAVSIVAGAASASVVCALAVGASFIGLGIGRVRALSDRRALAMREEVPEAIRSMSVCFRTGLSLPQALMQTGSEVQGPLGGLFCTAARRLEMGSSPNEALAVLRDGGNVPELSFVAVALDVQHQSGGSLAAVLEAACCSVEDELGLLKSLRVQTAQAKLSAQIVTMMPFVLIALFSLVSEGFLDPFFGSLMGMVLLGAALAMQFAGVMLVRRMLQVDVG